jgi:hypothetical protein
METGLSRHNVVGRQRQIYAERAEARPRILRAAGLQSGRRRAPLGPPYARSRGGNNGCSSRSTSDSGAPHTTPVSTTPPTMSTAAARWICFHSAPGTQQTMARSSAANTL